ncbi:MAG: hypothetical protein GY820_11340 [Gammaproteobacteria bacterium]|nr:hypothetical protein [Gammaproteobacteria bacterium]
MTENAAINSVLITAAAAQHNQLNSDQGQRKRQFCHSSPNDDNSNVNKARQSIPIISGVLRAGYQQAHKI